MLLNYRRWRVEQYEEVINSPATTPAALEAHLARALSRFVADALVAGSVRASDAAALAAGAVGDLARAFASGRVWPGQEKDLRVVKVPAGRAASVLVEDGPNPKDANSAAAVLYQVGPDEMRANALAALLVHLGKRDAFNVLRTQEQLGYIVSMFLSQEAGVRGVALVLQSDKHSAAHLAARSEAFARALVARLGALSAEEFAAGVEELAKAKLERPKRLGELASRWWAEVHRGSLRFDRPEAEVAALRALAPADLAAFARRVLSPGAARRKLVVLVRGAAERRRDGGGSGGAEGEAAAGEGAAAEAPAASTPAQLRAAAAAALGEGERLSLIADAAAWKRRCELYATPPPAGEAEDGDEEEEVGGEEVEAAAEA